MESTADWGLGYRPRKKQYLLFIK